MDFDIGNLVYIILTILFIAIGSLGKKKKPVNQNFTEQVEEEVQGVSSELDEFFNSFSSADDQTETASESTGYERTQGSEAVMDSPYSKVDNLDNIPDTAVKEKEKEKGHYKIEDHISDIMGASSLAMESTTKGRSSFASRAVKDFDARKAWLYSEVFKHKYF